MKMILDLKNQLKRFQNFDLMMVFFLKKKKTILKQRLVDLVMMVR
jgi:hypothetical protein